ncbi:MAG: histidine kinase [Bacteroidota bacterium]
MRLSSRKLSVKHIQWIIWGLLYTVHVLSILPYDPIGQAMFYSAINVGTYAVIVYTNAFFLLPNLYAKGKRVVYISIALCFVVAIAFIRYYITFSVYNQFYAPKPTAFRWSGMGSSLVSSILVYLSSILFYITLDFFKLKQKQEQLQKRNAETELNLLKAQVQPHFLFNTLNNIYFVAQRESPATAALIEQLSLIMRYFVDEAPRDQIFLSAEMNFVRSYLELEKMRMRYPLLVTISESGIDEEIKVPPMLLVPLVENVCKHGVDKLRNDNFILLSVTKQQNRLEVVVENRLLPVAHKPGPGGTGIHNLKSRLELLYGTDFFLMTGEAGANYRAQLNIPL